MIFSWKNYPDKIFRFQRKIEKLFWCLCKQTHKNQPRPISKFLKMNYYRQFITLSIAFAIYLVGLSYIISEGTLALSTFIVDNTNLSLENLSVTINGNTIDLVWVSISLMMAMFTFTCGDIGFVTPSKETYSVTCGSDVVIHDMVPVQPSPPITRYNLRNR